MPDEFVISGIEEVQKRLGELGPELARKAIAKALNAGAKKMKAAVQSRTPVLHGDLKKAVRITTKMDAASGTGTSSVGFGNQSHKAKWLELGHVQRGHKPGKKEIGHVPARPFVRPAFDSSKDEAIQAFSDVLSDEIQKLGTSSTS